MALLLKSSIELNEYCYGGPVYTENSTGQLHTKPGKVKDKIINIEQFTDAFMIFMSIYLMKYQDQAFQLLNYLKQKRPAVNKHPGDGCISYDEQFRIRKAIDHKAQWGQIKTTLWLTIVGAGLDEKTDTQSTNQAPSKMINVPHQSKVGLPCFDYNAGFCRWKDCKYMHVCALCKRGGHTEQACPLMIPHSAVRFPRLTATRIQSEIGRPFQNFFRPRQIRQTRYTAPHTITRPHPYRY